MPAIPSFSSDALLGIFVLPAHRIPSIAIFLAPPCCRTTRIARAPFVPAGSQHCV
jgi:hypothetical protein